MIKDRQLIFAGFLGACAMATLELASADWRARAAGGEEEACNDKGRPDTKAYMARLPNESHTTEFCLHAIRFGSPNWVPELGHPLKPRQEGK